MAEKLNSYMLFMGRIPVIIALSVMYIISQIIIASIVAPLGHDMLKLQITLSEETFRNIIDFWEKNNLMSTYIKHFYLDYFHPVIYSFSLSSLLSRGILMKGLDKKYNILVLLPFIAGLMDLIENTMHLYMINNPSRINACTVMFSGICTKTKWALAFICLAAAILLIATSLLEKKDA